MKFILLVFSFILLLSSCKDNVTDGDKVIVKNAPVNSCPEAPDTSDINFLGIESISDIKFNSLTLNWTDVTGAAVYTIYRVENNELTYIKTVDAPANSTQIKNLSPSTTYRFYIRMTDKKGLHDTNESQRSSQTSAVPSYINRKSLAFNGSQSVILPSSNSFFTSKNFTISLWFKTLTRQNRSDARLLNFHLGANAQSAFNIGVQADDIFLGYRDSANTYKRINHTFNYFDNEWHHVVATYNGTSFALYVDGIKVGIATDSLTSIGTHPAHIGAYTGYQSGFTGLIDEVSIWKSALANSQVQSIYNAGQSQNLLSLSSANNISAWYRMGDDSLDTSNHMQDQISGHHGTPNRHNASDIISEAP